MYAPCSQAMSGFLAHSQSCPAARGRLLRGHGPFRKRQSGSNFLASIAMKTYTDIVENEKDFRLCQLDLSAYATSTGNACRR